MYLRWSKPLIRFNRFLYVACVLLVEVILPQTLFTNPVFPTLPRKIPCVFPVKVTYKTSTKKNAKAKTKKLTYTLKVAKVGVALSGDSVVAIGSTTKLTNTKKNSSRAKITYTSSDDSIATVAADGTVTGVKAGKATITAKITVGKDSAETTKDVEVKNYVLKSVAQNKTNELVATIDGATKNIKASEVTIKTPDNVVLPVKSVSVDSKDATKVTLTTFSDMNDGKEYTVTLDGTTVNFVATDNKVASINIDKPTIPVKTETEIKLVAKDANGVILKELPYGTSDVNYDFSLTTANGYVNESKLYLNKVGDTATAEITYKTNKYTADGKADGNIGPNKLTITATDQAAVSSFKVRIGDANKKFSSLKDNDKIAVDETSAVWAYFEIKDTDGKEISNYSDYKVESSDKTTLMLGSDTMQTNNKVKLIPAKEGTAYIFIKKDDKIVASVPVTVVAARKVVTMTADKTAVTVSKSANANQETITLATKDQYGNDFAFTANDGSIEVTCEGAPDGVDKANVTVPGYASKNGNKVKYTVTGSNYVKGTYTFKFTFKKDGKEVCAQVVTVNVQEAGVAGDSISYSLNILNSNNATQTEEDAVVNADNTSNRIFTVNVSELLKGVEAKKLAKNDSLDDTKDTERDKTAGKVRGIYYTVKNAKGDVVYNTIPGSVTTGAAFNDGSLSATDQLTINVVKADASNVYAKLAEGTYAITATIEVEPKHTTAGYTYDSTKNTKTTITKSFVVKDTSNDAITDMKLKDAKVTSGASIQASLASVIQYSYDGVKYGADGDQSATIIAIEGYSNVIGGNGKITADNMTTVLPSGKTADVTKVTVRVAFHDADGNTIGYVDKEVKVSLSITAK